MHIAVLDANSDRSAFGLRQPPEVEKFRALMAPAAPGWRWSGFKLPDGVFPASLDGIDGVMISGSVSSVNDPDPWIGRLMDLIRAAVAADVPVFGACFGHQAIGKALGGRVGPNPDGWILGLYETRLHAPAPWMEGAAPTQCLHAAHKEQVLVPPPGATIHAGTATVPHGHMSNGARVFSTQYHPELDRPFMAALMDELDGSVEARVLDGARASLARDADSARMARWLARFFTENQRPA